VGTLVRLRIALADRPGALARVATIIANHGGNITSIDVQRAGTAGAVDDMVVDLPDDDALTALRVDLAGSGAATVLSHQAAQASDPVIATLGRATELLRSSDLRAEDQLARAVAEVCSSPAVWIASATEAAGFEAGRFALERTGAIAVRTAELPAGMAERVPGEAWLLAVPDPDPGAAGRVVFVARSAANEFTSTEIARIEALMGLFDQVVRLLRAPAAKR
jgi:hypothetical protein